MPKAHTMQTAAPPPGDRPGCALSIAAAVRRAAASSEAGAGDTYLRNADVATRAIRLLLPDEDIDEDTLEFGVSFAWSDVPSPTRLVRSFLEERAAEREVAAVLFVTHEINPILPLVDRVLYLVDGQFRIGPPDEVMTSAVLSDLYQTDVDVLKVRGRLVVVGTGDAVDALGSAGGHHHPEESA